MYTNFVGALLREGGYFKRAAIVTVECLKKTSSESFSALWASYRVARLLAKRGNPFSVGKFLRKFLLKWR
jgi:hypothetical protein